MENSTENESSNLVHTLCSRPLQALNKMTVFSSFLQWTCPIMSTLNNMREVKIYKTIEKLSYEMNI